MERKWRWRGLGVHLGREIFDEKIKDIPSIKVASKNGDLAAKQIMDYLRYEWISDVSMILECLKSDFKKRKRNSIYYRGLSNRKMIKAEIEAREEMIQEAKRIIGNTWGSTFPPETYIRGEI